MKTIRFFLFILCLIGSGLYLTASRFELLDVPALSRGEILPQEEWSKTLLGKWKYRRVFKASFYSWVYEGEVEYKPDNSFSRYITCKYYEGYYGKISDSYLKIIVGGSYSGKWAVNDTDRFFTEVIELCDISVGRRDSGYEKFNLDFCSSFFAPRNNWEFGDVSYPQSKFELKRFDNEKIVVKGMVFDDGASIEIVFDRLD